MGHVIGCKIPNATKGDTLIRYTDSHVGYQFINPGDRARLVLFDSKNSSTHTFSWLLAVKTHNGHDLHLLEYTNAGQTFKVKTCGYTGTLLGQRPATATYDEGEIPKDAFSELSSNAGAVTIDEPFSVGDFSTRGPVIQLEIGTIIAAPNKYPRGDLLLRFFQIKGLVDHLASEKERADAENARHERMERFKREHTVTPAPVEDKPDFLADLDALLDESAAVRESLTLGLNLVD